MNPCPMRFNGFSWHHNPKSLVIKSGKKVVRYGVPHFEQIVKSLYDELITVSGVGELYGEDCFEQYKRIEELYLNGKNGILCLPYLMPIYACFDKLSIEASTTPSVLTYSFSFSQLKKREKADIRPAKLTLEKDTTLWDVSYNSSVSLDELIKLNPDIMFINDLKKGQVVKLC
ncbi:MAG: hypothetical protein IJO20_05695 [Ruminococcus sp.]|nr:hypothetical protein [Ruminococcus sp.]MBQ7133972.1 hypothetical protein [Ruminococcus sp.]